MKFRSQCKQCYYFENCKNSMPCKHDLGVWNTIQEKREFLIGLMMDCFKSPEQYQKDKLSQIKKR